jgi:hypothetical protein
LRGPAGRSLTIQNSTHIMSQIWFHDDESLNQGEFGFGGRQAEAVTLTAKHTQGNPNWITFCAGVWSQSQNVIQLGLP